MTNEERKIVLEDTSARLPFGVVVNTPKGDGHLGTIMLSIFGTEYGVNIKAIERELFNEKECEIKPCLRPISSMTDSEIVEFERQFPSFYISRNENRIYCARSGGFDLGGMIKFFNQRHLDYNDLIKKNLAVDVTKVKNPYCY